MNRMFKNLVESSRKKLSKASPQQPAQAVPQVLVEPRKKPDFEPLESRVLFSGIGTGFNKKSVSFIDAWGDSVLVKLIGGPGAGKFNITLDGGANNHADIQNITLNNKTNYRSVLDIYVRPKRLNLSATYTGGTKVYGDPNRSFYAITKDNQILHAGVRADREH